MKQVSVDAVLDDEVVFEEIDFEEVVLEVSISDNFEGICVLIISVGFLVFLIF